MLRLTETLISKKIIISTISRSSFDTHVTHYEELILLHIYDCKEELILKKTKEAFEILQRNCNLYEN